LHDSGDNYLDARRGRVTKKLANGRSRTRCSHEESVAGRVACLRLILARLLALNCALIAVLAELADGLARELRGSIDSPRRLAT